MAALWIAGQPLSVASMVGFITLTGISARNGILKVSHYINLVLHEGEAFGPDMVVRGSLERLTPVLMTALSAGLALLPLILGADAPGKEILHPVAITIFGGLVSATLLDTLLTPVLFLRVGRKPLERLMQPDADGLQPAEAFAHGIPPAAAHGGVVAESSGEQWVELVVHGDQMTAWVLDEDRKPAPGAQLGGKATVLAGGKREEVALAPGEANSLSGKLATPVSGKMTAVLQLTVGGKPATVRFAVG